MLVRCLGTGSALNWDRIAVLSRFEILEDELAVGYDLCEERFANGKARKRARYEAFWDEKGRKPAGPSPLRNVVSVLAVSSQ